MKFISITIYHSENYLLLLRLFNKKKQMIKTKENSQAKFMLKNPADLIQHQLGWVVFLCRPRRSSASATMATIPGKQCKHSVR